MLELKNINYQASGKQILNDINFSVDSGETVTIIGPSGSGKSTILKLIAKMISPSIGEILLDSENIATLASPKYRKDVSYCFQQPVLFGKTVSDNFKFVFEIRNETFNESKVLETIANLDLKPEILSQKTEDLSGGEKQRVALARNTIFLPRILLLDEVTTGLDLATKTIILRWLDDLNKNNKITMIKVTHEEDEIQQSQRLIKIQEGKIVK